MSPQLTAAELAFELEDLPAAAVIVLRDAAPPRVLDAAADLCVPVLELTPSASVAGGFALSEMGGGAPRVAAASGSAFACRDSIALVLHTSGTTSKPKIVPLTHENVACGALCIASTLRLGASEVCINVMPLFHIHGLSINVLASLHDQCTTVVGVPFVNAYYTGYPHVFPLLPINIILCVFGAINGIQLCIMPITFMSTWFGAPPEDIPKDYKAKKFMGLDIMPDNPAMTFFARNVGIHFVSLSLTCAVTPIDGVSSVFYHPMFAMIGLLLFTSITANNIHAMQLQDAPGTTAKHYKMTYVPQIIIGLGIAAICACTMIRLSPPLHGFSKASWEAAGVAEDRAEALSQIQPIWEWRNGSSYQHIPYTYGSPTNVPYGLDEECLENRANEVADYLWRVARAAIVAELGEDSEFVPGYPPPSPSAP